MHEIRLFEAFAGYGSQLLALRKLEKRYPDKITITPVGISEIDGPAITAYHALHGNVTNYGDISKIDWSKVPDFDLFTMSSPCQDFSMAGKMAGGEKGSGTRSSLLWECEKAIEAKRPKYILFENVAALVSQKFIRGFNKWQYVLERLGYVNFAELLNSKDYGVPQNRERIIMVSIRADSRDNVRFYFPKTFQLERKLKDVLEEHVEERYFLSDRMLQGFLKTDACKTTTTTLRQRPEKIRHSLYGLNLVIG